MLLISETFISPFKFWEAGQIHKGMRFRNQLFRSAGCFDTAQRQQVFDISSSFVQAGQEVVITTTRSHYTIWVCLISPKQASPQPASPQPLSNCSTQSTMALNWNRLTRSISA